MPFITCGSVDDGKSTLIGRLLYEAGAVFDDQLAALKEDSLRFGTAGSELDFALLMDGLEAEREQNITIEVAHAYFSTATRSFIVADTPGHEQYTRNMATAASNAELAIILVDASKGMLAQTRRHSTICSLLGISNVVLAINKMDLVDYRQDVFDEIVDQYLAFCSRLSYRSIEAIPLSALNGDNITQTSGRTPWFRGPTLLQHLEAVDVSQSASLPFRFHVQRVNRPTSDFRGFSGSVSGGSIRCGDTVIVAGSGSKTTIARIVTADGDLAQADVGDAVTLAFSDEIDAARGDLLCEPDSRPSVADQFAANVIWMSAHPLIPGRSYSLRSGTRWVPATISAIKHKIAVEDLSPLAAKTLALNEVGVCNLSTAAPIAFDPYSGNRHTGSFILVDRSDNQTVAAGMIKFALRRATNIHRERLAADKRARASLKHQRPCILWFTGLPASGKSTIARLVEARLHALGYHTYMLDGDNLRHGLNRDLGFTEADRVENIRRAGETARLFVDAGLIVMCAFISPFRADRRAVREMVDGDEFIEVFVDTPAEECHRRDPKGLYKKAATGEIKNFTGYDSPYEPPDAPDIALRTLDASADELADRIVARLRETGHLS
jgi:bifunctional enzyme CysN/CysC